MMLRTGILIKGALPTGVPLLLCVAMHQRLKALGEVISITFNCSSCNRF